MFSGPGGTYGDYAGREFQDDYFQSLPGISVGANNASTTGYVNNMYKAFGNSNPAVAFGVAAIDGGFQLYSNWQNNKYRKEAQEATWAREDEVYERQKQDALEQWNRQNEYDSYAAQMQRASAAGLNSNLIYGSLGANGTAASMPSLDSSAAIPSEFNVNLSRSMQLYAQYSQMELQKQLAKSKLETDEIVRLNLLTEGFWKPKKYESDINNTDAKTEGIQQTNKEQKDSEEIRTGILESQFEEQKVRTELLNTELKYADQMWSFKTQASEQEIKNLQAQYKDIVARTANTKANTASLWQAYNQAKELFPLEKVGIQLKNDMLTIDWDIAKSTKAVRALQIGYESSIKMYESFIKQNESAFWEHNQNMSDIASLFKILGALVGKK